MQLKLAKQDEIQEISGTSTVVKPILQNPYFIAKLIRLLLARLCIWVLMYLMKMAPTTSPQKVTLCANVILHSSRGCNHLSTMVTLKKKTTEMSVVKSFDTLISILTIENLNS